jgi:hypothetical protein
MALGHRQSDGLSPTENLRATTAGYPRINANEFDVAERSQARLTPCHLRTHCGNSAILP